MNKKEGGERECLMNIYSGKWPKKKKKTEMEKFKSEIHFSYNLFDLNMLNCMHVILSENRAFFRIR